MTLSGVTAPDQSGSGSDDSERVLRISQSSRITRDSPCHEIKNPPNPTK